MDIIFDIETTSLDPLEEDARVIAIGYTYTKDGTEVKEVITSGHEEIILKRFWNIEAFKEPFRLIGFNSFNFDIPYLLVRSFKYGMKVPDLRGRGIDLRFVLTYGNKFKNGKLDDYTKLAMGERYKKINNGNNVLELWKNKEIETIKEYCSHDVFLTSKIHQRLISMGIL